MRRHGRLLSAAFLTAALPLALAGCEGGVASKPDPLAGNIIDEYIQPRVLTYRVKTL